MKRIYQIIYLAVVFFGAVFFFGSRMGETLFAGGKETVQPGEAAFPTMSVLTCGEELNCLYGYSSNLETILNREDMIPIGPDGIFELKIKEYDTDVRRLKYEILDVSSEAEVDSGTVNAFEKQDGCKIARIKLKTDLKDKTEYAVKATLISNTGKRIYYYFRLKQYETPYLTEKIDFIRTFVENARSANAADNEKIIPYLETKAGTAVDSFHYVNIYDSYKTVAWGDLTPKAVTEPVVSVTEFYDEIMTAVVRYCVTIDVGFGDEYYFVEEFFRIRYLGDVVHLLNFERYTESLFDVANASLSQSDLKLGITSPDSVELYPNSDHTVVAFLRNGSLYSFSMVDNTITTVFSGAQSAIERMFGQQKLYDIRVLKVKDSGDITFLVSGYMNRGVYEGRVGLFVYRYYEEEQSLEELIYVPVNTTYQILKEELGGFAYLSDYDVFYFMVNRSIYEYNLVTDELKELAGDVRENGYVYSVNERYVAYQEHDHSAFVTILYPESGERTIVKAEEGEYIRLLGKSEENLVYGYGKNEDLYVNEDGRTTYAMYKVQIRSAAGELMKEYQKEGYYVEDAEVSGNIIRLTRLRKGEEGRYEGAPEDHILNLEKTETEKITLSKRVTDRLLTEYYISFPQAFVMEEVPKEGSALYTVVEKDTTLRVNELDNDEETYYTYYYGLIDGIYDNAGDAILAADEKVGTVINEEGKIVWERGIKSNAASVQNVTGVKAGKEKSTIQAAVQMMTSFKGVSEEPSAEETTRPLQQVIGEKTGADTVVLTGATLDEVLYFVWKGQPVLAMTEPGVAVVITAYNTREVTYYSPEQGRNVTVEKARAEALFEEGGQIFISYLY